MTCPICNAEPCSCAPMEKWPEELKHLTLGRWDYYYMDSYYKNVAQRLANRIAGLEAIVAKLPKTADGVPIAPGDTVWPRGDLFMEDEQGAEIRYSLYDKTTGDDGDLLPSYVYSTREAAIAAAIRQGGEASVK